VGGGAAVPCTSTGPTLVETSAESAQQFMRTQGRQRGPTTTCGQPGSGPTTSAAPPLATIHSNSTSPAARQQPCVKGPCRKVNAPSSVPHMSCSSPRAGVYGSHALSCSLPQRPAAAHNPGTPTRHKLPTHSTSQQTHSGCGHSWVAGFSIPNGLPGSTSPPEQVLGAHQHMFVDVM
jgi:hypothetical protein